MSGLNSDLIKDSIERVKGKRLRIGNVACHESDPISRNLVRYEDDGQTAVLSWGGVTKRWPASEVFDPNDVKALALNLLLSNRSVLLEDYDE